MFSLCFYCGCVAHLINGWICTRKDYLMSIPVMILFFWKLLLKFGVNTRETLLGSYAKWQSGTCQVSCVFIQIFVIILVNCCWNWHPIFISLMAALPSKLKFIIAWQQEDLFPTCSSTILNSQWEMSLSPYTSFLKNLSKSNNGIILMTIETERNFANWILSIFKCRSFVDV